MNQRIIGFDLARCFAFFGMVLVNFKIAMGAGNDGPTWLIRFASAFDGRAAATFVVLAGVGISLMTKRAREENDQAKLRAQRLVLLKRALFLFVVGLLYIPVWPADILHFYGLYLAVAVLLIGLSGRSLVFIAFLSNVVFTAFALYFDYEAGWNWETLNYAGFWSLEGFIRNLLFNGFHPVFPWVSFVLVGMVVGRLNFDEPKARWRLFLVGCFLVGLAESSSHLLQRLIPSDLSVEEQGALMAALGTEPMPPTLLYILAGCGAALCVISLSVMLGSLLKDAKVVRPFVATGQMALTLYVAHVLVGMGGLGVMGKLYDQSLSWAITTTVIFCGLSVVFSWLWRRKFSRGPLELVMRKIAGP